MSFLSVKAFGDFHICDNSLAKRFLYQTVIFQGLLKVLKAAMNGTWHKCSAAQKCLRNLAKSTTLFSKPALVARREYQPSECIRILVLDPCEKQLICALASMCHQNFTIF